MTSGTAIDVILFGRRAAIAAAVTALVLAAFDVPAVHAQGFRVQERAPTLAARGGMPGRWAGRGPYRPGWHRPHLPPAWYGGPAVVGVPSDVIEGDVVPSGRRHPRGPRRKPAPSHARQPEPVRTASGIPYIRYSANTYPVCARGDGAMSGACGGRRFAADLGGHGPPPRSQNGAPLSTGRQAAATRNYRPGEIVAEIVGTITADADAVARRHGLVRVAVQEFPLIGSTVALFRIAGHRTIDSVQRELRADAAVRAVQPNFRYILQDATTSIAPIEGDPAQYALAKLRLPEAHQLARGRGVTVAVIDSGIDAMHPELVHSIVGHFDALGGQDSPHLHGTGIAGAIVAHARLMGAAPSAGILAIRAFGIANGDAESTSFVILRSLDYAASHGARVINMSFAGPQDALVGRGLAAAAARGIVMVAASGNAGPSSPPLYPAADPHVIAVSATDAEDHLFAASNRGSYIAVAAPGVDIFLPAPGGAYQMTSGTSFSAAYVSGVAALLLERKSALTPGDLRDILTRTARDLGPPGRDDQFGAGEVDGLNAVTAVTQPDVATSVVHPTAAGGQGIADPVAADTTPAASNDLAAVPVQTPAAAAGSK